MVIVAGHLVVTPANRAQYLVSCADVVKHARQAPGCLDYALTADLLDSGRVNIVERWESQVAVESFRGSGSSDEQNTSILSASVAEYDVANIRSLT
jgi:quinol monooxygenase YgiN